MRLSCWISTAHHGLVKLRVPVDGLPNPPKHTQSLKLVAPDRLVVIVFGQGWHASKLLPALKEPDSHMAQLGPPNLQHAQQQQQ
jgi:hypothetical protein